MKKFNFKWLLLSFILSIASINQVWAYTATFRIVPALTWGDWWDEGTKNIRVSIQIRTYGDGDWWRTETGFEWKGLMYESGGNLYKIYEVTDSNLPGDGGQNIKFMLYRGDTHEKDGSLFNDWASCSTINSKLYTTEWATFTYKTWDIPAGTTVVWDAGNQETLWTAAQMYYYKSGWNSDQSSSTTDFTRLGTTQQFRHTYDGKWEGYGGLIIRQSSSWNGQTTNIPTDVESSSNIVLFTHSGGGDHGSYTGGKCDWQKVSPAYKATSGVTVYFDNTVTNWTQPYLKYGSQWFNRSAVMSVVPGTDGKLWKYTFPNDMYYGEYMVADGYGYVNYNPIDDSHCSHYTALQASHISSATTLIPTENAQKGATDVLDGYTRSVTISSYAHGTVTVTYTDVNGDTQTPTSSCSVQQAAVINVTAEADDGYTLTALTLDGEDFDSGDDYTVRSNITIAATFTANTFTVHFNANYPSGTTNNRSSMSDESFTYNTSKNITANAFACEGYTFAGWKIDNAGDVIAGGSDGCTLTTEDGATVQLYAQWTDDKPYVFKGTTSGKETVWSCATNWTKGKAPSAATDNIVLLAPVVVDAVRNSEDTTISVANVKIATSGSYTPVGGSAIDAAGHLTIAPKNMLKVTGAVQKIVANNALNNTPGATTSAEIRIQSDENGNGALVMGTNNGETGATVEFYTKAKYSGGAWTNQYIGTPFTTDTRTNYNYYYAMVLEYRPDNTGDYGGSSDYVRNQSGKKWQLLRGSDPMYAFKGYNLLSGYSTPTVEELSGTLVSNADQTGLKLYYNGSSATENMFANSWQAPIYIGSMSAADFGDNNAEHVEATVYIFNAGTKDDEDKAGSPAQTATSAGQYISIPISSAAWVTPTITVIPSMQAFSVVAKAKPSGDGNYYTLNLRYSTTTSMDNDDIVPNRAPKRTNDAEKPDILRMRVSGENGSDNLCLLIRNDFSNEFENGYDAHKLMSPNENATQIYAITEDGNLSVNCVNTADNNVIGFQGTEGEYEFTFSYDGDEELYLKDTKTNIETAIDNESKYIFTSAEEDSEMRFVVIKKSPQISTGTENISEGSHVQKFFHNGAMYIVREGRIYSAEGSLVK